MNVQCLRSFEENFVVFDQNNSISTAWVIEHPSHAHIVFSWLNQKKSSNDFIFATDRPEIRNLLDTMSLYGIETIWLPRPGGDISRFQKLWRAIVRMRLVEKRLRNVTPIVSRIICINSPLEIRSAAKVGIRERILALDVEVDHITQRIAAKYATQLILPDSWRSELAIRKLSSMDHLNIPSPWTHVHLKTQKNIQRDGILVRRLNGKGTHDKSEIVDINPLLELGLQIEYIWNEDDFLEHPWNGPIFSRRFNGVISQSVTVAIEAALNSSPVLLASKAKRGVIDDLIARGAPIWIWTGPKDNLQFEEWKKALKNEIYWSDSLGSEIRSQWETILNLK